MARRLALPARVVLASHNPGKLAEMQALIARFGVTLVSAAALGIEAPVETANDFAGNARIKGLAVARASGLVAFADDSGFCTAALAGSPGVYSARWARPSGDFSVAMERVHRAMNGATETRAWFVSALVLAWPDDHTETFQGRVDGDAVWPPRGANGFGYDPMFAPVGSVLTFGEMTPEQKRGRTHRARAFEALAAACLA